MADNQPNTRKCLGADCANDAGNLQCPTCLKAGVKDSYFCSQDCFKRNWVCSVSSISPTRLQSDQSPGTGPT